MRFDVAEKVTLVVMGVTDVAVAVTVKGTSPIFEDFTVSIAEAAAPPVIVSDVLSSFASSSAGAVSVRVTAPVNPLAGATVTTVD